MCYMRGVISLLLAFSSATCAAEVPRYLPSLWQRWDASDLVCVGFAFAPVLTGITRTIDGSDRDQLSSEVKLETCFKGKRPASSTVRVVGYSAVAGKDIHGGSVYAGPPTEFVRKGRNLLFLRYKASGDLEMAVPIYETAIRLADGRPDYPDDTSAPSVRFALTQELEAALVQFDSNDIGDIRRIFDLLGDGPGIAELSRFSKGTPVPIHRDIAVALLEHDQLEYEPTTVSLLIDLSAPAWKRANAAGALGRHGTAYSLSYLRQVTLESAGTDDLKSLHVWVLEAIEHLQHRLTEQR